MTKRNKRNRRTQGGSRRSPPPKPVSPVKQAVSPPEMEIKAAHAEAMDIANEEDISAVGGDPRPDGSDPDALWQIVREARDVFHSARDRYESRNRELDDRDSKAAEWEASLTAREERLQEREGEVAGKDAALDERENEISSRDAALGEREIEIRRRELNADEGFAIQREEMLSRFDESVVKHREVQKERERALDEREARLAEEDRDLAIRKRRLGYDEEDMREQRDDLDRRVEQRMAVEREKHEHRIRSLEDTLEQARGDRDRHAETLRQREDADRKFGQRTPDEVLKELEALRADKNELQQELAERPDTTATARLADLESEREAWQAERMELLRQVSESKKRLAYLDNDANEREVQRDRIVSLESQRQLLHKANEQLRSEIDDLLSRTEAESPFLACTAMDSDSELQSSAATFEGIDDLKSFAEDLRQRIAFDQRLYYTPADVRSFLGGLAMGPLVLLQGISGTGKTSLPRAFARAVGTEAAIIEVQAGWRDPQDLAGHYNAFEKRFYEKEFLQALYRAGTPRYEDAVQIVLLDEMNLSYPEQYFSDLLSTLELPTEDRRLVLMPHSVDPAPALFREGRKLPIPPNVWFVGTANHDETTMDFADKTYDRSHVMEFPHRPEPFAVDKPSPRGPLSSSALRKRFEDAIKRRTKSADKTIEFLEKTVREPLANRFDIGWGPRLERQIGRYVPVVAAAGGTVGEATDHMLAMRLLRKLKNRHDNRPEHLEALRQRIEESWPALDKEGQPTKSFELLDSELRRLGRDPESET